MVDIQITVKNVDKAAFEKLKAEAAKRKKPVGAALSLVINEWIFMREYKIFLLSGLKTKEVRYFWMKKINMWRTSSIFFRNIFIKTERFSTVSKSFRTQKYI